MYIYEKWWKFITFFIFFCYKNTNLRSWSRKYSKNVSRAVCCTGAGNSRASLLVLHGKLGSTRRFSSMDARLQILRSRRCTGCPVKMVFFSQKFSLFCHLSLASTGLQLVVQKLASQYTIGVTVSVHSPLSFVHSNAVILSHIHHNIYKIKIVNCGHTRGQREEKSQ